jgi:hypothetical protein
MKLFRGLLRAAVAGGAVAIASAPAPLLACAACTGKSDGALAQGMNWGIVTLLGFILSVLSCFIVFFVHVARRSTPDDPNDNPPPPSE